MTNTFCKRKTWGPYFMLLGPSAVTSTFANSVDVTAEGPNSMKYGPHVFLLQNCICHPIILLLTATTTILDKKQPPRYRKNSRMPRGTNNCGWLLRGRKENCGKPCAVHLRRSSATAFGSICFSLSMTPEGKTT